jgi:hypothetical protein
MTSDVDWDPNEYDKEFDDLATTFYEPSEEDHEE